jgi:hypothetical protein
MLGYPWYFNFHEPSIQDTDSASRFTWEYLSLFIIKNAFTREKRWWKIHQHEGVQTITIFYWKIVITSQFASLLISPIQAITSLWNS